MDMFSTSLVANKCTLRYYFCLLRADYKKQYNAGKGRNKGGTLNSWKESKVKQAFSFA